jgi:uncharacterized RDD family membrane protein YckC
MVATAPDRVTPPQTRYAGIATRAVALAVDAAVANALVLVAAALLALVASLVGGLRPQSVVAAVGGFAWALAVAVYFTSFWSLTGQTPGMRLMHVRVTTTSGRPLHATRAAVRVLWLVLSIVPLFAGFLPVLFDDRRRGLHDLVAGTVVVYSP